MDNSIGKHLATFNLFREADHSIHVTIADARGVRAELGDSGAPLYLCAMNALRAAVELQPLSSDREAVIEECAAKAEASWPRAHTYASENADLYRAQDHARDCIVRAIRALKQES